MTTGGDSRISGVGKRRLRRGCIWTLLIFTVGFYAGLQATKRALTGPDWLKRIAGITLPLPAAAATPIVAPPVPIQTPPPAGQAPPLNSNLNSTAVGPAQSPGSDFASGTVAPHAAPSVPQTPPEGGWLVGNWEITDELHPTGSSPSTITSDYIFEAGGTGEFDSNGQKLYDLHWEDAGEYVLLTFATDVEGDQNLKIKMKYSLNADHSLLTLLPEGKKDPRGQMYNVGPGTYHRKAQAAAPTS